MQPINPGSHSSQKNLVDCNPISPLQENLNNDDPKKTCSPTSEDSLRDVGGLDTSWFKENTSKRGFGFHKQCDPVQTGATENLEKPNRDIIYRQSNAIRGADEAMQDLFRGITVKDENGKMWPVPIIYAVPERAVAAILQDNVRKDSTLVIDRIKLPLLSIYQTDLQPDMTRYTYHEARTYFPDAYQKPSFYTKEKYEKDTVFGASRGFPVDISYTLNLWTMFFEDAAQIREQILLKFSPIAYIQIQGVHWESIVSLESTASNIEAEPGESQRVIKYQFSLKLQTYIPQPISRRKAVLRTRTDLNNSVVTEEITDLFARLEEAVEELK